MNMKNLKKKKIILILVLFIGISASFAFYQTRHTFENEFITLQYGQKVEEEFESPNNWKPGDTIPKTVAIKNTGDICENIRVKYTEKWESKNGTVLPNIDSTINENVAMINLDNQNDWIQKGEYYYYNKNVLPGENTTSFLESVTFNPNYSGNITCETITENNQTKQQCKPGEDSHIGGTYTLSLNIESVQCNGIEDEWDVTLEELQNKYNITYHLNGGSLKNNALSGYPENNEEIVLPTPEKRGYDFTGWYESNDFSTERIKTIPKNSTGDKEYYANWKVREYKIKYHLNEGVQAENPVTSYTIETETFSLPIPTREHYTFEGWKKKSDFTGDSISEITKGTTGNKEYYAKWKIVDYNISYTLNSGTCSTCQGTYNIETETFTLATPTRTGHTFNGWTGSNGTTPQTTVTISKGSSGDKNYTANWTANTYTVSYVGNGATGGSTAATTCTYGQTFTPRANGFTRTGHTFAGWSGSTTCTGNMTMTATWTANTYTVSYAGNGATGGSTAATTCTYGQTFTPRANGFTRTGHTFNGWSGSTTCTGNMTMTATWKANTYTVSYAGNGATGGSTAATTCTYGQTFTPRANGFTRTGHTFNGWSGSTTCSGNMTMTATWKANTYTVSYAGNGATGGSTAASTCTYGQAFTPRANGFTRTGYIFNGWSGSTTCTGNMTMTATWVVASYYAFGKPTTSSTTNYASLGKSTFVRLQGSTYSVCILMNGLKCFQAGNYNTARTQLQSAFGASACTVMSSDTTVCSSSTFICNASLSLNYVSCSPYAREQTSPQCIVAPSTDYFSCS